MKDIYIFFDKKRKLNFSQMSAVHAFFSRLKQNSDTGKNPPSEADTIRDVFGESQRHDSVDTGRYHVAVQGCCHGELNKIYEKCVDHEKMTGKKIDLLICCGDFQSMRRSEDLMSMAAPRKYLQLGDFHEYFSTDPSTPPKRTAPYLTVFVGGNHENSDWLAEESYGGFLAPNIYYLGHSGVITVDDCVNIAGLSGIFKGMDYQRPYPSRPYAANDGCKRSAYHVRKIEVEKLNMFFNTYELEGSSSPLRIHFFVSHDWPSGITKYGNEQQLLRYKPFFAEDIAHGALGNPYTMPLLRKSQPEYWVAAHLHCSFTAKVPHLSATSSQTSISQSISTSFIALDKCCKVSGFLDFIDLNVKKRKVATDLSNNPLEQGRIRRHPRWVRILKATHTRLSSNDCNNFEEMERQMQKSDSFDTTAAEMAMSTRALLQILGLQPSYPLQALWSESNPVPNSCLIKKACPEPKENSTDTMPMWEVDLTPTPQS